MAKRIAHASPLALRWARESIGLSLEDAAKRANVSVDKLDAAERGESDRGLTLRQVEAAAKVYERPLAALFLPVPVWTSTDLCAARANLGNR